MPSLVICYTDLAAARDLGIERSVSVLGYTSGRPGSSYIVPILPGRLYSTERYLMWTTENKSNKPENNMPA